MYEDDYEENSPEITSERINFKKFSAKTQEASTENNIYCDLVTTLNTKCKESSLLEIWQYKEDLINTATQQEIIDAVNLLESSPWYGYQKDFSETLGGITRNSTGHIVAAKSELMLFFNKVDYSQEDLEQGTDSSWRFEFDQSWWQWYWYWARSTTSLPARVTPMGTGGPRTTLPWLIIHIV